MEGAEEKPGEHSCRDLFQAFPVHHLAVAGTDGAGENAESSYERARLCFRSSGIDDEVFKDLLVQAHGFVQGSSENPWNESQVQRGPWMGYTPDSVPKVSGADGCECLIRIGQFSGTSPAMQTVMKVWIPDEMTARIEPTAPGFVSQSDLRRSQPK
jgi:hypothetical protein